MAEPTQVIIVRHAEKAAAPADDPALSAAGQARADELSRVLQSVPVTSIITTHYRRTQDTAAPVAQRLGLKPVVIATRKGDMPGHIQQVADAVRQASGVVLVVGHSNTVPGLVAALSGSRPVQLCETSFSHLFVLGAPSPTAPALNLRYGAVDEPAQAGCL